MMVPWIYLCYSKDPALADKLADSNRKQPMSANSSKLIALGGTSTNINKSANLLGLGPNATSNQLNSVINDSAIDLENEFGYMTDEDSIFHSFSNEAEKTIPRLNRMVSSNKDPSGVEKEVKDMFKRVS